MTSIGIAVVLNKLLNQQELPLLDVVDEYFHPEYRQRTNGCWDNRNAFIQHMLKLRELVASVKIEVLDELQQGLSYADRHLVHVTKRDGSLTTHEVYLFAQLHTDGRFLRVEETTLMLEGKQEDHKLGMVK